MSDRVSRSIRAVPGSAVCRDPLQLCRYSGRGYFGREARQVYCKSLDAIVDFRLIQTKSLTSRDMIVDSRAVMARLERIARVDELLLQR